MIKINEIVLEKYPQLKDAKTTLITYADEGKEKSQEFKEIFSQHKYLKNIDFNKGD